jgi:hypothetical protein
VRTRKRPGPRRIGAGRKRSGKRRLYREDGTQADLATWRSLTKRTRTYLKNQYRGDSDFSLRSAMKRVRQGRRKRGVSPY